MLYQSFIPRRKVKVLPDDYSQFAENRTERRRADRRVRVEINIQFMVYGSLPKRTRVFVFQVEIDAILALNRDLNQKAMAPPPQLDNHMLASSRARVRTVADYHENMYTDARDLRRDSELYLNKKFEVVVIRSRGRPNVVVASKLLWRKFSGFWKMQKSFFARTTFSLRYFYNREEILKK